MCEILHVGKSTVTKAVKSIIKSGYVSKEKSLEDNRSYRLYLNEKGKEIAPRIQETFDEINEIYKRNLSEKTSEEP